MKIAIISVTDKGKSLSQKLKNILDKDSTVILTDIYYKNVKKSMPLLFDKYDAIIAIMASGILIRSIAPLINSKITDPAILNMDENGKYVISVLSGHMGGANKLTVKIANLINSEAIITTATDVNQKLGIDTLANDLFLEIENPESIVYINKAILNGEKIIIQTNDNFIEDYISKNTLEINLLIENNDNLKQDEIIVVCNDSILKLHKRKIVVGIGCRRNKSSKDILTAIEQSLRDLNLPLSRIDLLTSAEIKKDEKGLLELSEKLKIPIHFVELDKLKLFKSDIVQESEFVKSKFGIIGVCEPSALISAGFDSQLIYKKTAYDGVTISIAVSKKEIN